jgi:cytidylate kinase
MGAYGDANLHHIVHRHIQNWQLQQEVTRRRETEIGEASVKLGPFITLSRYPWCRGDDVSRLLAKKLEWPCFDREIVEFIAEDAGIISQFVDSLDEDCQRAMDDWIQMALDPRSMGHLSYFRHLKRVMFTIAMHGNAVIVGRGGNFLLPKEAGLRVLITAPAKLRARWLAESKACGLRQATKDLGLLDVKREQFLKTHFRPSTRAEDHYDLVINMECMDPDLAASLIVDAFYTLDLRSVSISDLISTEMPFPS